MRIFRQLCSRQLCRLGVNTAHEFPIARVSPYVDTAFVLLKTKAANLPLAQFHRYLPAPDFSTRPALTEAFDAHAVSPRSVAHTCLILSVMIP